ncbi:MAG: TrkH family potassium uptake protein [Victivallales bacterium]
MNIRSVINVVSALTVVIGLAILTAAPVAWVMGDGGEVVLRLTVAAAIPMLVGGVIFFLSRCPKYVLGKREGYGIVTFGWTAAAVFGALPFIIVSDFCWYDAFFETMSGFTTTGASVLDNSLQLRNGKFLQKGIADLPCGLLYWRSLTHWLGGMGIVVLSLAIVPFLGSGGQALYDAEVPGPTSDQLTPRIANSAKILWGVYLLLSLLETLLLWGAMPLFDAWCHTCGTMATGGFSTRQASIGFYNSVYVDWIIVFFMFLAGGNFVLHYRALRGKPVLHFKDEEFRWYLYITLIAIATITMVLMIQGAPIISTSGSKVVPGFANAVRYAAFQVVSILTTTGFCTADFALWPAYAGLLLVILMFIGGCGGSTGGGMKVSRFLLLLKYGVSQVRRCLFPHEISNVHLNKTRLNTETLHKVLSFFFLFVSLFVIFSLLLSLYPGVDYETATSASIAALGNIGPGLGKVGAACTYAWLHPSAKLILSLAMLLGRLEVYTVLVVLLPTFWKK